MSAIVGIHNLDNQPVERTDVERMVETLAHRGPDGVAIWSEDSIGLGHRMLWTTPESLHETLPLIDKVRDLTLTSDARIDNRDELLEALGISSSIHDEITDSQLILAAYVKWGEDCPQHLLGDFAFVIWDGRNHKLFCARDHFGIKPFYYHYSPGHVFVCASEIKAIFAGVSMPRRVNEKHIAKYLLCAYDDEVATSYQDVVRLPAAHTLTLSRGKLEIKRCWDLRETPMLPELSDQQCEQRLREILFEAVRCRMRAPHGPQSVGSFLSGGLDSSAVACVAREIRRQEASGTHAESDNSLPAAVPTLSMIFDDPELKQCDEREYIDAVLEGGDLEPHWTLGDSRSVLMDKIVWHLDEPITGPNLSSAWEKYQVARSSGMQVILDGHGGDETIGFGYARLRELSQAKRWGELWHELKAIEKTEVIKELPAKHWVLLNHMMHQYPMLRWPRRALAAAGRRVFKKQLPQASSSSAPATPTWQGLMNDDFATRIKAESLYQEWQESRGRADQSDRAYNEGTLSGALQPLALEILDKAAAAAGVEARYPLWDKRLVEFCLGLPSAQKLRSGVTRSILRRSLQGILPEKVRQRIGKNDFSPQALHSLRKHEIEHLNILLEGNWDASSAFLDMSLVEENLQRLLSLDMHEANQEGGRFALSLVQSLSLELWLRQCADVPNSSGSSPDASASTALIGSQ